MVEALDVAASYIDHLFANPITVNIEVGYGEITQYGQSYAVSSGAEGGSVDDALWSYAQTLQTFSAHITSPDQQRAYSELLATSASGGQIDVSAAQQKAFGQLAANGSSPDGSVGFQVNGGGGVAYDFNPLNRANGNGWDFIGVALHEISHALGRVSMLGTGYDSLLDRFRYAAAGQLQTNVTGSPAYFSLDGGVTNLANFDTTNQDPADSGAERRRRRQSGAQLYRRRQRFRPGRSARTQRARLSARGADRRFRGQGDERHHLARRDQRRALGMAVQQRRHFGRGLFGGRVQFSDRRRRRFQRRRNDRSFVDESDHGRGLDLVDEQRARVGGL